MSLVTAKLCSAVAFVIVFVTLIIIMCNKNKMCAAEFALFMGHLHFTQIVLAVYLTGKNSRTQPCIMLTGTLPPQCWSWFLLS